MIIDNDRCHDTLLARVSPSLRFDEGRDCDAYREALREKFFELTGLDKIRQNAAATRAEVEREEARDGYRLIRFTFESERDAVVPCYLLIPSRPRTTRKFPLAICLQGHSRGMIDSITSSSEAAGEDTADAPFALQALEAGFAALCIEQRGMGERKPLVRERLWGGKCSFDALTALLLGRTIAGERMFDVSRAIDAAAAFDELDLSKILITGNSGGGTAAYYAACADERIGLCAPSCSFCTYPGSIFKVYHCVCNYIPRAYEFFDMPDLAALIAPRRLAVIAGRRDPIFTAQGVCEGFEVAKRIYAAAGAEDHCSLVMTEDDHKWNASAVWNSVKRHAAAMGWDLD